MSADADRLTRWQDAGGTWQVLFRRPESITVALCRCDGGEEVERFTSVEPDLLDLVGDRETSEDPRPGLTH